MEFKMKKMCDCPEKHVTPEITWGNPVNLKSIIPTGFKFIIFCDKCRKEFIITPVEEEEIE